MTKAIIVAIVTVVLGATAGGLSYAVWRDRHDSRFPWAAAVALVAIIALMVVVLSRLPMITEGL